MSSIKTKTLKVCESCGKTLECGARGDSCWCTELKLSRETAQELQKRFADCLCRDCLQKLAKE